MALHKGGPVQKKWGGHFLVHQNIVISKKNRFLIYGSVLFRVLTQCDL